MNDGKRVFASETLKALAERAASGEPTREVPLAKAGEFDARAFVQVYYAAREGSHPSAIFAIHETDIEIAESAYAAGLAASGEQRVTPEMMSEVFAKSVNCTEPDHAHLYDHRVAADLLNKKLAAPAVAQAQLSEEQMQSVASYLRSVVRPGMNPQFHAKAICALLRSVVSPASRGDDKDRGGQCW